MSITQRVLNRQSIVVFRDGNRLLVIEIMSGRFLTEACCYLDKLFDGIRWVTTRIYRASCALINGFWWLLRLTGLMVVTVLTLSLYVVPAMFLVQPKAMLW